MDMVIYGNGATMFKDEELSDISEVERGPNFIEVKCVLKSQDHGERAGKLKVFVEGKLEINCDCVAGCQEDKLSPRSFLIHNERRQINNWKSQICVIKEGDKRVPLRNTPLLKYYYKHKPEEVEGLLRPRQAVHRDEFIACCRCGKDRRFHLRTMAECRTYHDALAGGGNWTCADSPYEKITCEDPEERQSRKACRGCPASAKCEGCIACVCVGCGMCRFKDCDCQTCIDFIQNMGG